MEKPAGSASYRVLDLVIRPPFGPKISLLCLLSVFVVLPTTYQWAFLIER